MSTKLVMTTDMNFDKMYKMNNLPKLNPGYWALMLLCTTMGELIGNLLSRNFQLGYTQGAVIDVCVYGIMILFILALKLKHEMFYWILILMGNIGGTNLADWVTLDPLDADKKWGFLKPLELGTKMGSAAVMASLLLVLTLRYLVAKKQSALSISNQVFYWLAILLSSTFGTTSGDLITNDTPLGALGGSIFLGVLLLIAWVLFKTKKLSLAAAYWSSLVLMHPIGATIGNWISKPIGLNLGNVSTNISMAILFALIFVTDGRVTTEKA